MALIRLIERGNPMQKQGVWMEFNQEFVKYIKYEQKKPVIARAFALYGEKFVFGAAKVRI